MFHNTVYKFTKVDNLGCGRATIKKCHLGYVMPDKMVLLDFLEVINDLFSRYFKEKMKQKLRLTILEVDSTNQSGNLTI